MLDVVKVHMLEVVSVCGKDIFQVEDPSLLWGTINFHDI